MSGPTDDLRATAAATLTVAVALLVLDLVWLGVVGAELYNDALGPLRRTTVYWPAALGFYAMYVAVIVVHCVHRSTGVGAAARRGAQLGFVAYATYELTNWAVISGWPAILVPIDIAWGVVLTSVVAAAGKRAAGRLSR